MIKIAEKLPVLENMSSSFNYELSLFLAVLLRPRKEIGNGRMAVQHGTGHSNHIQ